MDPLNIYITEGGAFGNDVAKLADGNALWQRSHKRMEMPWSNQRKGIGRLVPGPGLLKMVHAVDVNITRLSKGSIKPP